MCPDTAKVGSTILRRSFIMVCPGDARFNTGRNKTIGSPKSGK